MGLSIRAAALVKAERQRRQAARQAEEQYREAERRKFDHDFLDRRQAAAFLGLKESTLKAWYAAGTGPAVCKFGTSRQSRVRYPRAELVRYAADPVAYDRPARECGRFEPPRRRQSGRDADRRRP